MSGFGGELSSLEGRLSTTPILRLPDFSKTFYVETGVSDIGIGVVLLQDKLPIAFYNKMLGPHRRVTSTYHKELYAIVKAVQKWRQYLLGQDFIIRSDQKSLRELLQQVIQTSDQQLYIRKLMGYKFRIKYKSGATNRVATPCQGVMKPRTYPQTRQRFSWWHLSICRKSWIY